MAISISADTLDFGVKINGVYSSYPNAPRRTDLDQTYDCLGPDRFGNYNQGVLPFDLEISGIWLNQVIDSSSLDFDLSISGDGLFGKGVIVEADPMDFSLSISGDYASAGKRLSWVKWPRIGTLDFTIDKSNRAGEMPMDWPGSVTGLRKLGDRIISYGSNGVSILTPAGKMFGLNTIHKTGLLGRDASAGSDFVHFFIDKVGRLYQFDTALKLLDYREYLASLTNPVLTLDMEEHLLYICDGTNGYIYSPDSKSLGKGPPNVSGIGYQDGTQYAVAPAAVVTPAFEICTDIYDFGTRQFKSVFMLNFGTNLSGQLQAAMDFRRDITDSFTTTPWVDVSERGWAKITRKGSEFRFRARLASYEYFELDRFEVDRTIHVH